MSRGLGVVGRVNMSWEWSMSWHVIRAGAVNKGIGSGIFGRMSDSCRGAKRSVVVVSIG